MNIDLNKLLKGDKRQLAKAITLVESKNSKHKEEAEKLLQKVLPHSGKSIRIGISGVPGVGKSTFIECLGNLLIKEGHKVSVLAVDPSSPVSGGSIMGDKTRMETLSQSEDAFIRPSPAGDYLGGVAAKTREVMHLCEAAGFDITLVETVGVGQSEHDVFNMVDCFVLLILPNSGDEIQGIKKGIIELTDFLVVNKSDGDRIEASNLTQNQLNHALHILGKDAEVLQISSLENKNIYNLWSKISEFIVTKEKNGLFQEKRDQQNIAWFNKLIVDLVLEKFSQKEDYQEIKNTLINQIKDKKVTSLQAAKKFVSDNL